MWLLRRFAPVVEDLQKGTALATPDTTVDGEYVSYRAIHPLAVICLVFGILSVLCLLDLGQFWLLPALAFVTGLYALRQVQRMPDVLTGEKVAKTGLAIAGCFFLISGTIASTHYLINWVRAGQFGTMYAAILQDGSLEEMTWYELSPQGRATTKPNDYMMDMVNSAPSADILGPKLDPFRTLRARRATKGQTVTFTGVKQLETDKLDTIAMLAFEVAGPTSENFPEPKQEALVVVRGNDASGVFDWTVESMKFVAVGDVSTKLESLPTPTKANPRSRMPMATPPGGEHGPDDGHNHDKPEEMPAPK